MTTYALVKRGFFFYPAPLPEIQAMCAIGRARSLQGMPDVYEECEPQVPPPETQTYNTRDMVAVPKRRLPLRKPGVR